MQTSPTARPAPRLDRIEAVIADARTAFEALQSASRCNQPAAFDAARARFDSNRDRALRLLDQARARPPTTVEALAAVEASFERLEQLELPSRPDGLLRVAVEEELEALQGATCPEDRSRYEWHRWINQQLRAIVEVMPPAESDVLALRMARQAPTDPLGRWLASRVNAVELLECLRDRKRRARIAQR